MPIVTESNKHESLINFLLRVGGYAIIPMNSYDNLPSFEIEN